MNSLRRFTSLCIGFSFLVMSYTGIFLFLSPKGRVANWTNWELFGLNKTQYTNLHVTFMVLFLVGIFLHIYLNWNSLLHYLQNKAHSFSLCTKEFLFAFSLNLLFLLGTLYYWVPFDKFLNFEDDIKRSWEQSSLTQAPYGHAELSTLKEFAMRTSTEVKTLMQKLVSNNIQGVSEDQSIAEIAKINHYSPAQMFDIINNNHIKTSALKEGGGYGKLTLQEASVTYAFSLKNAIRTLKEKDYNATETSTLKESAEALHVKPIELLESFKSSTLKE